MPTVGVLSRIADRRARRDQVQTHAPTLPELPAGDRHLANDVWFEALIRPHIGRLLTIARGIVGSDDLAWDAVQEALLGLWQQGRVPPNVEAWLVRAVTMRSLFVLRTRNRRRKHEQIAAELRPESVSAANAWQSVESRELRQKLEEALADLSDEHRVVFVLREIDGMDYDSIAHAIGVPVGTVRSRLNRARSTLRSILKSRLGPEFLPKEWSDADQSHGSSPTPGKKQAERSFQ